jgi:hypothetical protein
MGPVNFTWLGTRAVLAAVAATFAACASMPGDEVSSSQPHGVIEVGQAPVELFPVVVQAIDGKPQSGATGIPRSASLIVVRDSYFLDAKPTFRLAPGEHTLDLTAVVKASAAAHFLHSRSTSNKEVGKLKVTVENGKHYFIAARVDNARPDEWEAVVYRTEDLKPAK